MKRLQKNLLFKVLCILLCCALFGAAMGVAAHEIWSYVKIDGISPQYDRNLYGENVVAASYLVGNYRQAAVSNWKSSQKENLNVDEQRKQKQWTKQLDPNNTNFRYRIYDLNGKYLDSNLAADVNMEYINTRSYLVGITEDADEVYTYDTSEMVPSENHDFNVLLNRYYEYDEDTQAYYSMSSADNYRERYDNWQLHCADPENMEGLVQETMEEAEMESEAAMAGDEEPAEPAEETVTEPDVSQAQPLRKYSYDSIDFEQMRYDEATQSLQYFNYQLERFVPASEIAPPVDYRAKLVAIMEWGVLSDLPQNDDLKELSRKYDQFKKQLPTAIAACVVLGLLSLLSFALLLYGCGHKEGVEGVRLAPWHRCPLDLLLVLEICVVSIGGLIWMEVTRALVAWGLMTEESRWIPLWCGVTAAAALLVVLPFFTTWAAQVKDHSCLRRTLTGRILMVCGRIPPLVVELFHGIRLFPKAVAVCCAYGLAVVFCSVNLVWNGGGFLLLLLLLALLGLGALVWWLRGWDKVQTAAQRIAQGNLHYQTDTARMPWDLKRHGEQLNAISGGMQKAVQEQMKSDRFRTELITNVSHDLKTPLTSIISYVDLLKKLDIQDAQAQEYIEVLDRKSQRLKTLTEDLVEASKAATGVLGVELERLDAGLTLSQALGEYQERLEQAGLSVVVRKPEQPIYIQADGRHLWRIMDNLLSNCAKYAMSGTRVYVTLEEELGEAVISVKNISAQPLNVPAEELMERFVRGDSSRTNEGSGLGLSIAQSLAAIQGAKFHVSVDGDLFKGEIRFQIVE